MAQQTLYHLFRINKTQTLLPVCLSKEAALESLADHAKRQFLANLVDCKYVQCMDKAAIPILPFVEYTAMRKSKDVQHYSLNQYTLVYSKEDNSQIDLIYWAKQPASYFSSKVVYVPQLLDTFVVIEQGNTHEGIVITRAEIPEPVVETPAPVADAQPAQHSLLETAAEVVVEAAKEVASEVAKELVAEIKADAQLVAATVLQDINERKNKLSQSQTL
jgi:hypothetical protein